MPFGMCQHRRVAERVSVYSGRSAMLTRDIILAEVNNVNRGLSVADNNFENS